MSPEEKEFLIRLLTGINIPAADPRAVETAKMVQSILEKLRPAPPNGLAEAQRQMLMRDHAAS